MSELRLPMTAFERLMLAEDTPDHPMTAAVELELAGVIRRMPFEQALEATLSAHPLLRALLDRTKQPYFWSWAVPTQVVIDWNEWKVPLQFAEQEYIDLTRESGMRLWIRVGDDCTRLVLQLHHCCTDGMGVREFVFDLLRAYAAACEGRDPATVIERDLSRLRYRDDFYHRQGRVRGYLRMCGGMLVRAVRWAGEESIPIPADARAQPRLYSEPSAAAQTRLRNGTAELGHGPEGGEPASPLSAIRTVCFSVEETLALRMLAKKSAVSLNDLLIRDLFLLLSERCEGLTSIERQEGNAEERQAGRDPKREYAICMPVNLREADDVRMPAANKMMMTFLRRSPEEVANPQRLLDSVRSETLAIKRNRRGLQLQVAVGLMLKLLGRVPVSVLEKKSFATTVLSNLGSLDPPESGEGRVNDSDAARCQTFGNLRAQKISTAPNGRPGTAAVIVVLTYAGRLTFSMRFDQNVFNGLGAERFLEDYLAQLRESAAAFLPTAATV